MALVYCCSLDGLIASIVLLICTSLWIKASAKWLNVNVNVLPPDPEIGWMDSKTVKLNCLTIGEL